MYGLLSLETTEWHGWGVVSLYSLPINSSQPFHFSNSMQDSSFKVSSDHPPSLPSLDLDQMSLHTPASSLSHPLSTLEKADKSLQTDLPWPSRSRGRWDAEQYLRRASPGSKLVGKSAEEEGIEPYIELLHPSFQYGDMDSLQGAEARKIPELLDFAESNLAAESPHFVLSERESKKDTRSRSAKGNQGSGVPLIMKNKLFASRMNKKLSVSPKQATSTTTLVKSSIDLTRKLPKSATARVLAVSPKAPRPIKSIKTTLSSLDYSPRLPSPKPPTTTNTSPKVPIRLRYPPSPVKSLKNSTTSLHFPPKLVKVSLHDFASRETGSGEQSLGSLEAEIPLSAPIPYPNKPPSVLHFPDESIEKSAVQGSTEGYNLVSRYRKIEVKPAVTREEGDRGRKGASVLTVSLVKRQGVVQHGMKSFNVVAARLRSLELKQGSKTGRV